MCENEIFMRMYWEDNLEVSPHVTDLCTCVSSGLAMSENA